MAIPSQGYAPASNSARSHTQLLLQQQLADLNRVQRRALQNLIAAYKKFKAVVAKNQAAAYASDKFNIKLFAGGQRHWIHEVGNIILDNNTGVYPEKLTNHYRINRVARFNHNALRMTRMVGMRTHVQETAMF